MVKRRGQHLPMLWKEIWFLYTQVYIMSLVAYGSSDSEEDSEEQAVPKVDLAVKQPTSKKQRETVKITIPSLDQFKDEDPEPETKAKPKFKSGSGLLSFLPPPKNSGSSYNFTPHILTKKKDNEQKPQFIKSSLEKHSVNNKQISSVVETQISSKTETISADISNNYEDNNHRTSISDFFSLESINNKTEVEVDGAVDVKQPVKSSLFSSLPEPAQTAEFYYASSNQEIESPFTSIPAASVQGISNEEEYCWNKNYDTVSDQTGTLPFIKDEKFQKFKGRREFEDINIIDVKADDQLTGKDEWLMQSLTEEKVQRPSKRRHEMPTQLQKRKHQITYLAYQAKERELDLKNQWALNRRTRRETQAKYGF
ncbi:proline-rich protein PRCC [Nephila pilipes]|uniref:Proline-rich protein PRCC n=1 Tax=Nephila pilipes TaxID=299642 RepID=A0A8X6QSH1_NEPPI|nr:proline-rich protein PRCC [Nephila pilipes]